MNKQAIFELNLMEIFAIQWHCQVDEIIKHKFYFIPEKD